MSTDTLQDVLCERVVRHARPALRLSEGRVEAWLLDDGTIAFPRRDRLSVEEVRDMVRVLLRAVRLAQPEEP